MKRLFLAVATALSLSALTGCGYNDFQKLDEASKA
ncbi:MAG: LemA family protein, partial [Comamonadaceae bacterium]